MVKPLSPRELAEPVLAVLEALDIAGHTVGSFIATIAVGIFGTAKFNRHAWGGACPLRASLRQPRTHEHQAIRARMTSRFLDSVSLPLVGQLVQRWPTVGEFAVHCQLSCKYALAMHVRGLSRETNVSIGAVATADYRTNRQLRIRRIR